MQTHEENLRDLIEALEISSAYQQHQERFWTQQGGRNALLKEGRPVELANCG